MAASMLFARRTLPPLLATSLVAAVGFGSETNQTKRMNGQGQHLAVFNASTTKCDAVVPAATLIRQDTKDSSTPIPVGKEALPLPLQNRTWLDHQTIVTKSEDEEDELVTDVYLLGTHHADNASARAAKLLLESVQPDIIFVELCQERTDILTEENTKDISEEVFESWSSLYGKLCSRYGGEFFASHGYAVSRPETTRPMVVLGDRPISVTKRREVKYEAIAGERSWTFEDLYGTEPPKWITPDDDAQARGIAQLYRAWHEQKESFNDFLIHGFVENADLTATLSPVSAEIHYPEGTERHVIVQERDVYMVCRLIQTCRVLKPKCIVAIVGAGHLNGMTHLIKASNIGTKIEPEEVLQHLLATDERPALDPHTEDLALTLTTFKNHS